jgi:AcrR family transcriptional regulator
VAVTVKPYHHGNLRAELLAAARDMLAASGSPADLSLREVARRVGVSHGAPRRHFADKQALLDALAEDGLEQLGAEVNVAMAAAGRSFSQQLVAFAGAYVSFAAQAPALLELMQATKDRPGAERLNAIAAETFAAPVALIARAQEQGDIVAGAYDRIAFSILATLQGLIALIVAGSIVDESRDRVVAETVQTLIDGLRPR